VVASLHGAGGGSIDRSCIHRAKNNAKDDDGVDSQ
jgi:hypothetical protein